MIKLIQLLVLFSILHWLCALTVLSHTAQTAGLTGGEMFQPRAFQSSRTGMLALTQAWRTTHIAWGNHIVAEVASKAVAGDIGEERGSRERGHTGHRRGRRGWGAGGGRGAGLGWLTTRPFQTVPHHNKGVKPQRSVHHELKTKKKEVVIYINTTDNAMTLPWGWKGDFIHKTDAFIWPSQWEDQAGKPWPQPSPEERHC